MSPQPSPVSPEKEGPGQTRWVASVLGVEEQLGQVSARAVGPQLTEAAAERTGQRVRERASESVLVRAGPAARPGRSALAGVWAARGAGRGAEQGCTSFSSRCAGHACGRGCVLESIRGGLFASVDEIAAVT